jgi:hypothetical protein
VVFFLLAQEKIQPAENSKIMFSDEKFCKREQKSNSFEFMPSAANFAQGEISFNDVPKAVAHLIRKVEKIETLLSAEQTAQPETERWFNLDDLCKYHPDHPAKPTEFYVQIQILFIKFTYIFLSNISYETNVFYLI